MKPSIKQGLIYTVICALLISTISSANLSKIKSEKETKQVHLVQDNNGFKSDLNHIVRRSPTVTTVTKFGANRLQAPSNMIFSSNSNTSNGPNVGFLGKTAELVGKIFFFIFFRTSYCYAF